MGQDGAHNLGETRAESSTKRHLARLRTVGLLLIVVVLGSVACEDGEVIDPEYGPIQARIHASDGLAYTTSVLYGGVNVHHPEGDPPTSYAWSWTVDGVDAGVQTQTVPPALTTKYEVWEVTVTAHFESTNVGPSRATITLINKPPEVLGFADLIDNPDCPDDPLVILALSTDADGDPITQRYAWIVNNVEVQEGTSNRLDCQLFDEGDRVFVNITPDDGEDVGATVKSNIVTIKPAPSAPLALSGPAPSASSSTVSDANPDSNASLSSTHRDGSVEASSTGVVPLSITESNVCHINRDGSIECTGIDDFGVTDAPDGSFYQLAVEFDYACAIRTQDSKIVCWGEPLADLGQLSPPEGPFTQIDLGSSSGCGLRTEGDIGCWGDDSLGQASPPDGQFIHLEMTDSYGCAMDAGGSVDCWGLAD
ncbi:MAG: hypothetical protein JRE70_16110 [Deltaproteobacteria bacterium]|nr:hypothetical protein [Deltaproteobacteria bacterium]